MILCPPQFENTQKISFSYKKKIKSNICSSLKKNNLTKLPKLYRWSYYEEKDETIAEFASLEQERRKEERLKPISIPISKETLNTRCSYSGKSIETTSNKSFDYQHKFVSVDKEKQQYKHSIEFMAQDLDPLSKSYISVPVVEFGAAMLRGMGWNGKKQKLVVEKPRHHLLGLGANLPNKVISRCTLKDKVMRKIPYFQDKCYDAKLVIEKKNLQETLGEKSIIKVGHKRGTVVKIASVPGLNYILIRYEGERKNCRVKKEQLVLVSQKELFAKPFEGELSTNINNKACNKIFKELSKDKSYCSSDRNLEIYNSNSFSEVTRKKADQIYQDKQIIKSISSINNLTKIHCQKSHYRLISYMKVRIIVPSLVKKYSIYHLHKGIFLEFQRSYHTSFLIAKVQLSDKSIISLPPSWLETVIPKINGRVIILNDCQWNQKGILLKKTRLQYGNVQLIDDKNIMEVHYDDMAEWCGAWED